jgi:uncharacterized protein (UPF0147 family)
MEYPKLPKDLSPSIWEKAMPKGFKDPGLRRAMKSLEAMVRDVDKVTFTPSEFTAAEAKKAIKHYEALIQTILKVADVARDVERAAREAEAQLKAELKDLSGPEAKAHEAAHQVAVMIAGSASGYASGLR